MIDLEKEICLSIEKHSDENQTGYSASAISRYLMVCLSSANLVYKGGWHDPECLESELEKDMLDVFEKHRGLLYSGLSPLLLVQHALGCTSALETFCLKTK